MCSKKDNNIDDDMLLFEKVKERMLKMCEKHPDIIEFQLFKDKLEQSKSFDDLSKML